MMYAITTLPEFNFAQHLFCLFCVYIYNIYNDFNVMIVTALILLIDSVTESVTNSSSST